MAYASIYFSIFACRFCMPLPTRTGSLAIVLGVVVAGFAWSTDKGLLELVAACSCSYSSISSGRERT